MGVFYRTGELYVKEEYRTANNIVKWAIKREQSKLRVWKEEIK